MKFVGAALSLVFALAFGSGGLYFGVVPLVRTFAIGWQSRDWQPVDAKVTRADMDRSRTSKGGTTYRVLASYRYEWRGVPHQGTQVGLDPSQGHDNIGDWHANWQQRLDAAMRADAPVTAWVDPSNPSRAVLEREVRWPMVLFRLPFALLFTSIGALGAWGTVAALTGRPSPWQQMGGRPQGHGRARPLTLSGRWFMAFLWNSLSLPIAGLTLLSDRQPWGVKAMLAVFAVIGIGLLVSAVKATLRARAASR